MTTTPLTVLDLVPISSGSTAAQALRNSIDLAQQAERLGYARYWFAEHHLNPGVAGTSPAVVARADRRRDVDDPARLRGGADGAPHRRCRSSRSSACSTPLHPGRFDLGLGRSGGRPRRATPGRPRWPAGGAAATVVDGRTANGLLIPPPFSIRPPAAVAPVRAAGDAAAAAARRAAELHRAGRRRARAARRHLHVAARARRPTSCPARARRCRSGSSAAAAARAPRSPATRAAVRRQLPRQPRPPCSRRSTATAPRSGLRPSSTGRTSASRPTSSSPSTDEPRRASWPPATACGCAASAPPRARSRSPPPSEARRHSWTDADRALVADRIDTQFVGTAGQVADQLERLRDATDADELIITTITHDHADRVRSYELLAEEWARR